MRKWRPYVSPTNEIISPILKIREYWVLNHLVGEIDVHRVFEQGETCVKRTIASSKCRVRSKVEDLVLYLVLGLFPNCIDIIGAGLVEPALAIRFGVLMQTGSKSERR